MIPATFVEMESLPLNSNGKIDRRALPVPKAENTLRDEMQSEPASPIEKRVAETLAHLLEVNAVGSKENFFDLGGHSLLATQFISHLRECFGVELTLRHLFDMPTVAGISATIEHLLLKKSPEGNLEIGRHVQA
jgi:acyl carrier protein